MLLSRAREAEEVLKESDSVGSPELTVVQARMEELKVCFIYFSVFQQLGQFYLVLSYICLGKKKRLLLLADYIVFEGASVEAEQSLSRPGAS